MDVRFHSELDRKLFLLEVGKAITEEINEDDSVTFLKKRSSIIKQLKDFRKSRNAKTGWRRHPSALIFALRRWHNSAYGKRMHTKLNQFMRTKLHKYNKFGEWKELHSLLQEEAKYYRPVYEQIKLEKLIEEVANMIDQDLDLR